MVKDLNDPTNRDTVPAMLTPGEFVLNKEATQMFLPQIEAMNNAGLQQRLAENQALVNGGMAGYNNGGLIDFLKEHEGFRDKAYQDSAGIWTIGYGRTTNSDGSKVKKGQTTTRKAEDTWINKRAASEEAAVRKFGEKHGYEWNDNQVNALASFRYNGGQGMLDMLTANGTRDNATILKKMPLYNKVTVDGKKVAVDGLTNRRNAEIGLWNTPLQQEEEVIDVSPSAEAEDQQSLASELGGLAQQSLFGSGATDIYVPNLGSTAGPVEYIPSVKEKKKVQSFNSGGMSFVDRLKRASNQGHTGEQFPANTSIGRLQRAAGQEVTPQQEYQNYVMLMEQSGQVPIPFEAWVSNVRMNSGGFASWLFGSEEDKKKRGAAAARRPGIRSFDPLSGIAATPPPAQPPQPSQFGADKVSPNAVPKRDPRAGGSIGPHVGNVFGMNLPPEMEAQPQIIDTPPVPGSDEAILQSSSQQQEGEETKALRKQYTGVESGQVQDPSEIENATPGVPQVKRPPQVPGDTSAPTDSGWASLSQEDFLQEAQPRDVDQPGQGKEQRGPSKRGRATPPLEKKSPKQLDATQEAVTKVVAGVTEAEGLPPQDLTVDKAVAAGQQKLQQGDQREMGAAQAALKSAFGDLINKKELARMGVLFLGAMATGASPGQALAFAGQNYLNRIDAIAANEQKTKTDLLKSGKYTPGSIAEYAKTQDPSVLQPVKAVSSYKELGNQKEFYGPQGQRVLAREVEDQAGNKIWVGPQGTPISLNQYHQDATRVKGTPEYRDRIGKDSKQMTDLVSAWNKQNSFKGKDNQTIYPTGIIPEKAGINIAKWAVENNVDPAEMGNIVTAALDQAAAESTDGKKVKNIEAYLNDQYIRATTGSADLFEGASAENVNTFINNISGFANLTGSVTQRSQIIIGEFKPDWLALDPGTREQWNKKAGKGKSGFMLWLQNVMQKELQ